MGALLFQTRKKRKMMCRTKQTLCSHKRMSLVLCQYREKTLRCRHLSVKAFHFSVKLIDCSTALPGSQQRNYQSPAFMMTSSNGNISALLAICAGNSPVTVEFPTQRPVTRSFGVFFYLRLNKRLSKQWWGWWFETPSRPLWRQCNVLALSTRHSLVIAGFFSQRAIDVESVSMLWRGGELVVSDTWLIWKIHACISHLTSSGQTVGHMFIRISHNSTILKI